MQSVYGFSGNMVQLLLNYGPIGWFVTCLPFAWHLDRYGARFSVLVSLWLVMASQVLRCFATDASTVSLVLVHVSFILNALAGPIAMGACSRISEDWFQSSERTTATAIMAEANNTSGIISWLLVPLLVTTSDMRHTQYLNYAFVVMSGINLLMGLIYFPNRPPTAPSASADVRKSESRAFTWGALWKSMVALSCNKTFMILMTAYAVISGVSATLASLLTAVLGNIGYTQTQAGWIGFATSCISFGLGVLIAHLMDRKRHGRMLLVGMLLLSGVAYIAFSIISEGWLPATWTSGIGGFVFVGTAFTLCGCVFDAAIPLLFELGIEATYPIPEGTVIVYMTSASNLATGITLGVPQDSVGVSWLPWAMAACCIFFAGLVWWMTDDQALRYAYDLAHEGEGNGKEDLEGVDDDYIFEPAAAGT